MIKRYSKRQGVVRRVLDIMSALTTHSPKSCTEISKETGIPERSVRYYLEDFIELMPTKIRKYRRKRRVGGHGGTGPIVYWLE